MNAENGVGYAVYVTAIDGGFVSGYTRNEMSGAVDGISTTRNIHNALVMEGEEMEELDAYLFGGHYDYRIFEW